MIRDKYRQVVVSVLLSFTVLLTSVLSISIANATPTVTRSLPAGSDVYAMGCYGDFGQLISIVTSSGVPTGAQTRIGVGTTDSRNSNCPRNAAYNPVTQTGYWVSAVGTSPNIKQHLFSIDAATGVSTYIDEIRADQSGREWAVTGSISGSNILVMYAITFDAAGNMYAMWRSMATDIWIGKVTPNDGKIVASTVKKLNVSNIYLENPYNFAFNSVDNKFYAAGSVKRTGQASPHLYEINIATGGTTDLGQSGDPNALFYGMQFDSNGVIWGGYSKIGSATVSGWTVAGDLQQTLLASYAISAVFIAPSLSTSPAAPTLNTVTGGDRSISVAFTAGANGGASITDYEYSLNGGTYRSAATTTSPFTITSEISGRTSYSVTLKAKNRVGLSSASGSLSATTTDSSADASEAAAAAAEAARVAAVEAARVAAVNAAVAAAAAKRAAEQKEMSELLAVLPSIAGLALNIGELTNSLLVKQKCVNGKKTKTVSYGSKCPKGYVKRK